MNDNYQSLINQERQDYFMLHNSKSSPTSTTSNSSPMTNIMPNPLHATNWQSTTAFPLSQYGVNIPLHSHQEQFPWALNHPQQHQDIMFQQHNNQQYQLQLQQQLQYQQQQQEEELWRSNYELQNNNSSILYSNHQVNNNDNDTFQLQTKTTATTTTSDSEHHVDYFSTEILHIGINSHLTTTSTTTNNNIPTLFNSYLNNKKKITQTLESIPLNITPLPSPVLPSISSKRKRIHNKKPTGDALLTEKDHVDERGEKRKKYEQHQQQEEEGVKVEFKGNQKAVDHLENELAFLRGECATILIMLDSLRNAFLADIPKNSLHQKPAPMLPSISTFDSRKEPQVPYVYNTTNHILPVVDTRRPSKIIAQNPEMEREMRTAYDDLWLQTRQLEKKVEALEGKSKTATIIKEKAPKKRRKKLVKQEEIDDEEDEEQDNTSELSFQTSEVQSSVLSEEEIYEEDQDQDKLKPKE